MEKIYNEIANRYNTTADEVEREIAYAISLARVNPSPSAKAFWRRVDDYFAVENLICNIVLGIKKVV